MIVALVVDPVVAAAAVAPVVIMLEINAKKVSKLMGETPRNNLEKDDRDHPKIGKMLPKIAAIMRLQRIVIQTTVSASREVRNASG